MPANSKTASWPLIAGIAAIVISPVLELATGQGALYTFWLTAMMLGLWAAQRLTRREVGVAVGDAKSYAIAVAYPVGIIGCVALGAWIAGLIDLSSFSATTTFRRLTLNFLVTFVFALITEEGFFRWALGGSCVRAGFSPATTLLWTSLAFGLWHLAVPIIEPDFAQPMSKVPQYVIGATVFGIAMGLLRLSSGSIVVPSFCHALWNATAYTLFGTGEKVGQLGIADPTLWDPERGYAGLVLAIAVAAGWWWQTKPSVTSP